MALEKPPLDTHYELLAPDGRVFRWAADSRDPANVPVEGSWGSKRYEGFDTSSVRLGRPVERDYPDLGLFSGFNVIGYDGSVAYEGMIGQVARSTPLAVQVEGTGWMASARHRGFRDVFVDPDMTHWQAPGYARRVAYGAVPMNDYQASSDGAFIQIEGPTDKQVLINSTGSLIYSAPPGAQIGSLEYKGTEANGGNILLAGVLVSDTPDMAVTTAATLSLDDTLRTVVLTPGRYIEMRSRASATHTPTAPHSRRLSRMVAYGTQGLTKRPTSTGEPNGYYVSDIIRNIGGRFTPLSMSGVTDTTWPCPTAAWFERTHPYDAWLELNRFHLFELGVFENRTLNYGPADLTTYDWQIRTTDEGVSVDLEGDSIDHLANYAVVEFTNSLTGELDEVGPNQTTELVDYSAENPANKAGMLVELLISLSEPTDPSSAVQIGRVKLAENNQPLARGTITFTGHIRDRAGHWQQGWKVRSSDTVAIVDWPNNRSRLVTEFGWNQDTKVGTLAVDGEVLRVDAYLDRVQLRLRAAGL